MNKVTALAVALLATSPSFAQKESMDVFVSDLMSKMTVD